MVKKLLMLFCFTFISSQSLQAEETLPTMDEENIEERLNQVRGNIETLFSSWIQKELDKPLKIIFQKGSKEFFILYIDPVDVEPFLYERHDQFGPYGTTLELVVPHTFDSRDPTYYDLNMFLGLHEVLNGSMTLDTFILIACHELGHYLATVRKERLEDGKLKTYPVISGEGQADYFSTAKCFKRYLEEFPDSPSPQQEEPVPDIVKTKCEEVYDEKSEQTICIRSSMTSLSLTRRNFQILKDWRRSTLSSLTEPRFETPDLSVVEETIDRDSYPSIQCRLDTLFQGALCDIDSQYTYSYCTRSKGYEVGIRPNCWLHPMDDFDGDVQRDLYVDSEEDDDSGPASVGSGGGGNSRIGQRTLPLVH